jgi:hypothetical protein
VVEVWALLLEPATGIELFLLGSATVDEPLLLEPNRLGSGFIICLL